MKSTQTGSLSRTDFAARLRDLAAELETGTLVIEQETLPLPESLEITQTANTTTNKGSYTLKLDWAAVATGNGEQSAKSATTRSRSRTKKTATVES